MEPLAFTPELAILPRGRVTMRVNDRKHQNIRSIDPVEHAVGEPAWDRSPDLAVDDLMLHRVLPDAVEEGIDLVQERTAEALALPLVPPCRFPDIRLRLAPDDQPVRHRSRRRSSRAPPQSSTSAGFS